MSKRFCWTAVDPRVTRAMLAAADTSGLPTKSKLAGLSLDALAASAGVSFGQPPEPRVTDVLVEIALSHWLPIARSVEVEELAEYVRAGLSADQRKVDLRTKAQRIEFLRQRNWTSNFKINVRRAFIQAHKIDFETPRRPSTKATTAVAIKLDGQGAAPIHSLHRHQHEAQASLDQLMRTKDGRRAGVLVLPTGSGKTETMVTWLLQQMEKEPNARVLWVAGQQELLAQAADRFASWARCRGRGFHRIARVIHSGAYPASQLSADDTDVALVTIQTLASDITRRRHPHIDNFMKRPTYVVVDEAHHGASRSYGALFERLDGPNVRALVGLTATPFPTSVAARVRFREHFPRDIHTATAQQLMSEQILARPVLHTVDTNFCIELDDQQLRQAEANDLPPDVLAQLDDDRRNHLVINTYLSRASEWGKTLVFATNIANADELHRLLCEQGVDAHVLHSAMDGDRSKVLRTFAQTKGSTVMVSVGMLTEGVDLPDARTAFLSRPTASRVLLQQMIGRVLRGPRAGGEAEANLVYFNDFWKNFADILEPPEVIDGWTPSVTAQGDVPVVNDARGITIIEACLELGPGAVIDIRRQFERSPNVPMSASRLAGYYELHDRQVPVFAHQEQPMDELLGTAMNGSLQGTAMLSFFDDVPAPHPSARSLRDLVEFVREFEELPPFAKVDQAVGPSDAADRVLAAGPIDQETRVGILRDVYRATIACLAYPTFAHFEEAVEQELRARRDRRFVSEQPIAAPSAVGLPRLPRFARDLDAPIGIALDRCAQLLPADVLERLDPPEIDWSTRVTETNFAFWTIKLSGKSRGVQRIRVNRLLRTTRKAVPDDVLAYLIYHELLHHLLPGQNHDAEFRELEARWPNSAEHDAFFDSLHDHWDMRAEQYR